MQRFDCPVCPVELHFDNFACLSCGTQVGYAPEREVFLPLPAPGESDAHVPCANRESARCNWLVAPGAGAFCLACRHNRTVPDLQAPVNAARWRNIELAKRYLFYSLLKWRLPRPTQAEYPNGLAFDFLAEAGPDAPVLTGHAGGLITVNIAEADDAEREARRSKLGEPYRTLIGHMRHEVGHFYWEILVRDAGKLEAFRAVFGDERARYDAALQAHYSQGPPPGWRKSYISAYAAAHPWEDFAETWAHYVHMIDALETAHAFGMTVRGHGPGASEHQIEANPYKHGTIADLLADWVPLTVALNCLNRSLGQPDFYPFVLSTPVKRQLSFIYDLIHEAAGSD